MKQELDKQLCEKYPKIFRNRMASEKHTAMCWGFEHGDGWYNIIDALCANIQGHINRKRRARVMAILYNRALKKGLNGDGGAAFRKYYKVKPPMNSFWEKIIAKDIENKKFKELPPNSYQTTASQVKEKFGTLRFYVDAADSEIYAMINVAESMSARTCEVCGSPGTQNDYGWISTLCETHRKMENGNA
jgi:hypothetical protein